MFNVASISKYLNHHFICLIIIIEFCSHLEKMTIFVKISKMMRQFYLYYSLKTVKFYIILMSTKTLYTKWSTKSESYKDPRITALVFSIAFMLVLKRKKINMRIVMLNVGIHVTSMPFVQSRVWKHGIQRLYWIIFRSYIEAINLTLYQLKHIQDIVRECTSIEIWLKINRII